MYVTRVLVLTNYCTVCVAVVCVHASLSLCVCSVLALLLLPARLVSVLPVSKPACCVIPSLRASSIMSYSWLFVKCSSLLVITVLVLTNCCAVCHTVRGR